MRSGQSALDDYSGDADVNARLPLLSTYLGHVNPGCTYWYLQVAPELLSLAASASSTTARGRTMSLLARRYRHSYRPADRPASSQPNTIAAYRDTLRRLLAFATDTLGKQPSDLDVDDPHAPVTRRVP